MTATLAPTPTARRTAAGTTPGTRRVAADRPVGDVAPTSHIARTRTRTVEREVRPVGVSRPADRRPPTRPRPLGAADQSAVGHGTRCASPAGSASLYRRRRAGAAGILIGVGLAVMVWVVGIVGNNYADSVTPGPVGTEVVHVRQGDSLSTIAARVAPDMPRQTVIDEIVALNDMASSGLRTGQPLLTPEYR